MIRKKLIILGSVLLLVGGIMLGWILNEKEKPISTRIPAPSDDGTAIVDADINDIVFEKDVESKRSIQAFDIQN